MNRNTTNKIKATLFIIIFLLLAAVIIYFITGNGEREYYAVNTPRPTEAVLETAQPTSNITIVNTPAPTPVPTVEITATPQPTPEPTPEITAAPVIIGQVVGSNSFRSDTGALINIQADCIATSITENEVTVDVAVSLEYYTLYSYNTTSLNISLNGQYTSIQVDPIVKEDNTFVSERIGETSFIITCPPGQSVSVPVSVEWHFGGSYHGVDLPVIECGGTLNISR